MIIFSFSFFLTDPSTPYIIAHSNVYAKNPFFPLLCFNFNFQLFISIIIMNYDKDQLLALLPRGGNTICLAMRPRIGKHPKEM